MQSSHNTPYTFALSLHSHSAAVFGHETNCSCTKLHVTAVCYSDSTTDSIHRFSPICGIEQKATAGPTTITNRNSEVLQPYSCNKCVCVCVRENDLGFVYIKLCTDYVQVTENHLFLLHFCVHENRAWWFKIKKLNPEL